MSAKIMGGVWDLDLPHAEAFVLLAMADHADHDGNDVWPSVGLIAWKTGYSTRQVQRIIQSLVDQKILILVKNRGHLGTSNLYRIDLSAGTPKAPYRQHDRGDKMSGVTEPCHPQVRHNDVTPTPDIAMSPEPSLEPSSKPSIKSGAKAPTPAATRQGKPRDERLTHPAIVTYRDLVKITPSEITRTPIIETVGTQIEKWAKVITEWRMRGNKPQNIQGMLDWFTNGIPQRGYTASQKSHKPAWDAAAAHAPIPTPEQQQAQRDAARKPVIDRIRATLEAQPDILTQLPETMVAEINRNFRNIPPRALDAIADQVQQLAAA